MKNVFLFAFILTSVVVKAQNPLDLTYYLSQNVNYNAAIPTPKSVLGFEVGEMHSSHDKLVEYMKLLANVSDRISIEDRGKTFEGRPLLLLTITSSENHRNIESIRLNHLKNTDLFNNGHFSQQTCCNSFYECGVLATGCTGLCSACQTPVK